VKRTASGHISHSGPRGTRTHNPRIKSPLRCQLRQRPQAVISSLDWKNTCSHWSCSVTCTPRRVGLSGPEHRCDFLTSPTRSRRPGLGHRCVPIVEDALLGSRTIAFLEHTCTTSHDVAEVTPDGGRRAANSSVSVDA
jgi:hypothetical protein